MTGDPAVRRWRRAKVVALAAGVVLAALAPLWGPRVLSQLAYFRVRRVEIVGAQYIAPRDILARLAVDTTASVWDSPTPLETRVAEHPEVRGVRVRRRLPGTLIVEIDENLPVALVPGAAGLRVFDERGVALPIDPSRTVVDVPILARRDTAALRLLGSLRSRLPAVYQQVSEVRPTGERELWLRLGAVPVRLMSDVEVDRLLEIEPVVRDLERRRLLLVELDLRYRDQVIARIQ
jgi:cell division protein FtsQ